MVAREPVSQEFLDALDDIEIVLPDPREVREYVQRVLSGDTTVQTPDANFFDPTSFGCRRGRSTSV